MLHPCLKLSGQYMVSVQICIVHQYISIPVTYSMRHATDKITVKHQTEYRYSTTYMPKRGEGGGGEGICQVLVCSFGCTCTVHESFFHTGLCFLSLNILIILFITYLALNHLLSLLPLHHHHLSFLPSLSSWRLLFPSLPPHATLTSVLTSTVTRGYCCSPTTTTLMREGQIFR